ncbi:glycosyltransferase family 1 protein [Alteromonas sediminis]|uniref:Glycosyltransferase family 1 protein n=1 Tax=Alteromonas sediminis TaxID=2259342 RepID=A0A3N5Y3G7_9ALTE|nr:glycosyltransferase [Alteromonas sediminis]RPJ68577.1 glycosyltransferase family 1 protein [Alteromonas sediminis]
MQRDLIVFGEDWGGLPSSTQHLISHLAKTRKVLWVNSIGLRRPKLSKHDIKRLWHKLLAFGKSTVKPSYQGPCPTLIVNPISLPVPRYQWERALAYKLLQWQLKALMKQHGICDPVLWTSLPTAVDLAGKLGDRGLVYYCGDDFSALAGVDHTIVSQREQELVKSANLVITASEKLAEKHTGSHTQVLTHGVDYQLFSTPTKRAADLPNDGRPIAGFYGSLSAWIDLELLKAVIAQRPNWHFVFIGKPSVDISQLAQLENTHFLGERAHHSLPGYSQHWNVSLLPFRDNAQIRACNPLKLREYLATGTPVISTAFPALSPYLDYVEKVATADQFLAALDKYKHKTRNYQQTLSVSEHDWSARAALVSGWLEAL